jgi:phosphoglycolate phosphatase-like HAD superfamily hydrolase
MTQAELNQLIADRKAEMAVKMAEIRLANEARKIQSPLYERRCMEDQDNMQLDAILEQIEENYALDNRKISRVFGYGVMVDKILTIIRSIQYSKIEEKQDLLAITGLSETLVEEVLDALGNPAYFSVREGRVMDEIPADVARLRELLEIVSLDMGLLRVPNLSKVSQQNFEYQFTRARLRAEELAENTAKNDRLVAITYTE